MRCRLHLRKPVRSLLGAALTTGPRRMRPGRSQSKFSAAGCGAVVCTGRRLRQAQDAGAVASPSRSAPLLLVVPVSTFPYRRPRGPGVSVGAAGLNIGRGMSGPRSGSSDRCDPASCQRARPRGRPGAGTGARLPCGPPAAGSDAAAHVHLRWQGPQPLAQAGRRASREASTS